MGVWLMTCELCGIIVLNDELVCKKCIKHGCDDEYCHNCLYQCQKKCRRGKYKNDSINFNKNYIKDGYVSKSLYLDGNYDIFFDNIYWCVKNLDKNESEIFKSKLKFINEYIY